MLQRRKHLFSHNLSIVALGVWILSKVSVCAVEAFAIT